jgi:hypothetical protein
MPVLQQSWPSSAAAATVVLLPCTCIDLNVAAAFAAAVGCAAACAHAQAFAALQFDHKSAAPPHTCKQHLVNLTSVALCCSLHAPGGPSLCD